MDCSRLLRMSDPMDTSSFAMVQSAALSVLRDRTQWSRKPVGVKDERLSQILSSQYIGYNVGVIPVNIDEGKQPSTRFKRVRGLVSCTWRFELLDSGSRAFERWFS